MPITSEGMSAIQEAMRVRGMGGTTPQLDQTTGGAPMTNPAPQMGQVNSGSPSAMPAQQQAPQPMMPKDKSEQTIILQALTNRLSALSKRGE